MTKKERVEAFLKGLNELSDEFDIDIKVEGEMFLYDTEERNYIGSFDKGFCKSDYEVYEWD